jgi:hypothetical protein
MEAINVFFYTHGCLFLSMMSEPSTTATNPNVSTNTLSDIPEFRLEKLAPSYLPAEFDIADYLDKHFSADVEKVRRICKDELLEEELAAIEKTKQALITLFNEALQHYINCMCSPQVDSFGTVQGRLEERDMIRFVPEKRTDEKLVSRLALLSFFSELRRKRYNITAIHNTEQIGQGQLVVHWGFRYSGV